MGRLSHLAAVASLALLHSTAEAGITFSSPSAAQLSGTSAVFDFYSDIEADCGIGALQVQDSTGASLHASAWTDGTSPLPITVSGLPSDGSLVNVYAECRSDSTGSAGIDYWSYDGGASSGEVSGVVTLADGAVVTLAADQGVTIDSGLTKDEYDSLVVSILLMLVTAIGVRQLAKVLT